MYRISLLFLFLLLPIDWFEYSGLLFRELGAKPAIIYMLILSTFVLFKSLLADSKIIVDKPTVFTFIVIFIIGLFVFSFRFFIVGIDIDYKYFKQPDEQFLNQVLMFFTSIYCLVFLSVYFYNGLLFLKTYIRFSSVAHLAIFGLEYIRVLDDKAGFLLMFRVDGGLIERATGLMSEPSYYGVMAGLYGGVLIFCIQKKIDYVLSILLFLSAFLISAKTMFVVLLFQFLFSIFFIKGFLSFKKIIFLFLVLVFCAMIFLNNNALNLQENMSSAMRFGSTLLSINAALDGYGLLGVGFGQFHYLYLPDYAPSFLMLSNEALSQFSYNSPNRASTFNFFTRYLVELGVVSLVLLLLYLMRVMKRAVKLNDEASKIGFYLVSGSIGFLMTQDTYFYPPLIVGIAIILSANLRKNRGLHEEI